MLGISQEKLGERLGITFQQIQKYEKGTNRISASRLQETARFLQVPVAHFFEDAPDPASMQTGEGKEGTSAVTEFLATTEGVRLNKAFSRLQDRKLRRALVDLVTALAGDDSTNSQSTAAAST
jgi:transcriptional regulator with XRE-family HTH domain